MTNLSTMPQEMIDIVNERVELMVKDPAIQNEMMKFKTKDEAHNWIIMAAIGTLMGVQNV